jgi:hypothetical protein
MPRRHDACEVQLRRSWVGAADAEHRWLRTLRLLLAEDPLLDIPVSDHPIMIRRVHW